MVTLIVHSLLHIRLKKPQRSATALFTYLTRTHIQFHAVIDPIGGHEIWEEQALLSLPYGVSHEPALRANLPRW
jgi:hypothetical protein